jgi:hypothetical protein
MVPDFREYPGRCAGLGAESDVDSALHKATLNADSSSDVDLAQSRGEPPGRPFVGDPH